ncbi:hypothetical protein RJ640_013410 [Escallonia rubra]|uniref:PLATZ transcription factor family protein n=1 Tax=Escallonia rubra TaxID=112253 RepID=A0AA88UFU5_9ASTE|nr:hypothetical protein RJ640_013410 [Escallonia rubra]
MDGIAVVSDRRYSLHPYIWHWVKEEEIVEKKQNGLVLDDEKDAVVARPDRKILRVDNRWNAKDRLKQCLSMEVSNPQWLCFFLKANYEQHCENHYDVRNTLFCNDCLKEPFCLKCKKENTEHEGHQVLQIYFNSKLPSVRIIDIRPLLDITLIQPYIINTKNVLFLNQKSREVRESGDLLSCETCGYRLLNKEYKFCSIACKTKANKSVGWKVSISYAGVEPTATALAMAQSPAPDPAPVPAPPTNFRKRSIKGIPRRAPFF